MIAPAIQNPTRSGGLVVACLLMLLVPLQALALPGVWTAAGSMSMPRYQHAATLLPSGKVLVTGDIGSAATTDLYDPASSAWTTAAALNTGRGAATATLLPTGSVLVAGGNPASNCTTTVFASQTNVVCYATGSAELYSPGGNVWSGAGNLLAHRQGHTATLLPSGKLLIAGGASDCTTTTNPTTQTFYCTYVAGAELYDPASNTWTSAGTLVNGRMGHAATLLASGRVLVSGGRNSSGVLSSAEVYDPASNSWSPAASLAVARFDHTSTLLPSGAVYVAGGNGSAGILASAELYNVAGNSWSVAANLSAARAEHTATLMPSGKVLLTGGDVYGSSVANPELYDPIANTIAMQTSLIEPRYSHTATLLNNGKLLVTGGFGANGKLASAELFDSAGATYTVTTTATPVTNGSITPASQIVIGGATVNVTVTANAGSSVASVIGDTCNLTQTAVNTWTSTAITADCNVTASFLGPMRWSRSQFTATMLPSGKVLMAGGSPTPTTDLFDSATKSWSIGGNMLSTRYAHTATLLPSGKVLVTGGTTDVEFGTTLATTELYDPATNTWSAGGNMLASRSNHAAVLLSTGKVLVVGSMNGGPTGHAELYDPASNLWSAAAAPSYDRFQPTATLLPSGKVLLVGGFDAATQLYTPATNTWSTGGSLSYRASSQVATLLPSGKVLITGGQNSTGLTASAALYDPASNTWSAVPDMSSVREEHTATVLDSGKLLVLGGYQGGDYTTATLHGAELYDPASNTWSPGIDLSEGRYGHTATLLPNGQVLVAGGDVTGSVELYGTPKPNEIFGNGFEGH